MAKKPVVNPEVETPVDAPVVAPVVEAKPKAPKIGDYIKDKILNSVWNNNEILEGVKQTFPFCKTTYACIAWYRSQLRADGRIPPRAKKVQEQAQQATV
jgi:hypothetical protein